MSLSSKPMGRKSKAACGFKSELKMHCHSFHKRKFAQHSSMGASKELSDTEFPGA